MREQLISFLTSKKAIAGIAGAIVALAARWGLELPADELAAVLSPIIIYIVAQGRAASRCTPEDAREALRIAIACDMSREEQRPVDMKEVA